MTPDTDNNSKQPLGAIAPGKTIVIGNVPGSEPMWSQTDPFGFNELRKLVNSSKPLTGKKYYDTAELGEILADVIRSLGGEYIDTTPSDDV